MSTIDMSKYSKRPEAYTKIMNNGSHSRKQSFTPATVMSAALICLWQDHSRLKPKR